MALLSSDKSVALFSLPSILAIVAVGYVLHRIIQYAHLRQFKGHSTVEFSKIWLLKVVGSGTMHLSFTQANKKYGRFARIDSQTLLVSDVDSIRKVNARGSSYKRFDWYKGGRSVPNEDTLLSMTNHNEHKALRTKMAPGFNTHTENNHLEGSIDSQVTVLLNLIRSKYISTPQSGTKPMDWGYLASYFGIDSICDIAFSEPLGDMAMDQDKYKPSSARRQTSARFGEKAVRRTDMLNSFITHGMTPGEAERGGLLQLVARSETTATTSTPLSSSSPPPLSPSPAYAPKYPPPASPPIATPAPSSATLRHTLSPTFWPSSRRLCAFTLLLLGLWRRWQGRREDSARDQDSGQYVGVRDPEVYGEDADCFRPEPWLEVDGESKQGKRMDRNAELVFSAGRFICMRRDIALTQLLKVISELFYRFDLTVINPEKPWHSVGYGIFCQHDQWMRVTERNLQNEKAAA